MSFKNLCVLFNICVWNLQKKSRNQCENNNNNNKGDDDYNTKSEEKKEGGGKKQENMSLVAVLLKIDLHCDGCADKLMKIIRSLPGLSLSVSFCFYNSVFCIDFNFFISQFPVLFCVVYFNKVEQLPKSFG